VEISWFHGVAGVRGGSGRAGAQPASRMQEKIPDAALRALIVPWPSLIGYWPRSPGAGGAALALQDRAERHPVRRRRHAHVPLEDAVEAGYGPEARGVRDLRNPQRRVPEERL